MGFVRGARVREFSARIDVGRARISFRLTKKQAEPLRYRGSACFLSFHCL